MSEARYLIGDTREVLRTLPDASVDLVMTSPPFLALRSYLPADHPDKGREIGSEANPGAFLDVLLDVVVELRRVLAPHGSLCVELGDTYAGGGQGADAKHPGSERPVAASHGKGWPLAKSLCMVPSSFAWALAYGRNPWTGRELEPWRVRNLVAWCRPNPPVGALGDKFRPATSYMTVACTGGKRYFDLDAVREARPDLAVTEGGNMDPRNQRDDDWRRGKKPESGGVCNPAGAPPLDYWVIPTHPYPGSHYATYPPELCVKPIKAMCPERVCRSCGQPSERITETCRTKDGEPIPDEDLAIRRSDQTGRTANSGGNWRYATERTDLGWTDCPCPGPDKWRRGVVLDPFAGSGTTLAVATGHGRDAIGIDLDPRNADLARERCGMFLEVA